MPFFFCRSDFTNHCDAYGGLSKVNLEPNLYCWSELFSIFHTSLWYKKQEMKQIFEETSGCLTAAHGLLRARESNAGLLQNSFPFGGEFCLWLLASFVDVRAVCPLICAVFTYTACVFSSAFFVHCSMYVRFHRAAVWYLLAVPQPSTGLSSFPWVAV